MKKEKVDFSAALTAIKDGGYAARDCWKRYELWNRRSMNVKLDTYSTHNDLSFMIGYSDEEKDQFIAKVWTPSIEDIFAEDWIINPQF